MRQRTTVFFSPKHYNEEHLSALKQENATLKDSILVLKSELEKELKKRKTVEKTLQQTLKVKDQLAEKYARLLQQVKAKQPALNRYNSIYNSPIRHAENSMRFSTDSLENTLRSVQGYQPHQFEAMADGNGYRQEYQNLPLPPSFATMNCEVQRKPLMTRQNTQSRLRTLSEIKREEEMKKLSRVISQDQLGSPKGPLKKRKSYFQQFQTALNKQ